MRQLRLNEPVVVLARFGLGVFLIFPALVILFFVDAWTWPDLGELGSVLQFTFVQASLSALIAITLGCFSALGLLALGRTRWLGLIEALVLLPGFIPPLFVILPFLGWASFWHFQPYGYVGIIAVHALMNIGLCAVIMARLIEGKVAAIIELAWIEGASRWQMHYHGVFKSLQSDLLSLGFYVFTLCFASFAVPLILGGFEGVTLEVLIYEKVRLASDWSQAFVLSCLQIGILFLFSLKIKSSNELRSKRQVNLTGLAIPWMIVLPVGLSVCILAGQFVGIQLGWSQLTESVGLMADLPRMIFGTLFVGVTTGGCCFLLLCLVAFLTPHRGLDRFLVGYTAPSTVLTGFAFLLLGIDGWIPIHVSIVLGLAMILLPGIYRMMGRALVNSLARQILVGRLMGASRWQVYLKIVYPQICQRFFWIGGLAAFWASGDFALSSLVADNNSTLALAVKGYLSSYRLELATMLNLILLLVSSGILLLFGGLGFVSSKKFTSKLW